MAELRRKRLAGVVIENLDWRAFIERYDRPGTLFYLDPPSSGCEDDYGKAVFSRDDFAELAAVLSRIQGAFILSLNAVREVFETFSKFEIEEVDCSYSIHGQWRSQRRKGGHHFQPSKMSGNCLDPRREIASSASHQNRFLSRPIPTGSPTIR
ncbi:DNA adenine methylase [Rhizobium sp. FY34]|uniref:DNA adenine methylase n=1 Tax=Rhizobium sp. FY34 TaxID=2562309 RepID=UPI0010C028C4|nr:DNA adenine methylase [Rhizobium sp. FY34]